MQVDVAFLRNNSNLCLKKIIRIDENMELSHSLHDISSLSGKEFTCKFCNRSFAQKGDMDRHESAVHEGKKPFKCELCNYSSAHMGSMNKHITSVHEGMKPFKCEFCNYSCAHGSSMKRHVVSIHEGKNHSNVNSVTKAVLKKVIWINI